MTALLPRPTARGDDPAPPAPTRSGPTVDTVVGALVTALCFLIAVRPAVDNDLWFHLRAARWMLDHHDWIGADPFTHTRPDVVRVQTDWLSQLLLHGGWRVAGLAGVALLVAAAMAAAMLLLYRTIAGSVRLRAAVVVATAAASSIFWAARPQAFTYVGTIVVGALFRRWRQDPEGRLVWWLVPLVLVWTNAHGGVVYGILIIAGTLVGECANRLIQDHGGREWLGVEALTPTALRRLAAASLASVAVMVVNPSGVRVFGLPFHQVASAGQFVQEVQPPSLTDSRALPFFALLLLTAALLAWRRRETDVAELLVVLGAASFALQFTRSIPFFAVVAAPAVARHLAARGERSRDPSWNATAVAPAGMLAVLVITVLATLGLTALRLDPDRTEAVIAAEYPVGATAWIQANQPPRELFNTFDWGGWLQWELPEYPVAVDGRTDVYDDFLLTYRDVVATEPGWTEELDREGIGTVLVVTGSRLDLALRDQPAWRLAYEDPVAVVFVRAP